MQALPFIKQLRSRLKIEFAAAPECLELERTERMLSIYEQIVIQRGLQRKEIGPKALKAFEHLFAVVHDAYPEEKAPPIRLRAPAAAPATRVSAAPVVRASAAAAPATRASGAAAPASRAPSAAAPGPASAPFARWIKAAEVA
ncbi:hypothetical protein SS37A_21380 [Methylocystis iwaonis]|uniref:Uncharacterized protein n=1 Tax=Methylocystis iwaonis TaxID=2885079 RepID=A0ABN6VGU8_9HYPH|nr:hypothetical protein SS37A_21380 [Methylocystis iwaonis]